MPAVVRNECAPAPSFSRTLSLAALGGAGAFPWIMATGGHTGLGAATSIYGLALVVLYPLAVGGSWRQRLVGALVAMALAIPVAVWKPMPELALVVGLAALATVRSLILFPRSAGQALLIEAGLAVVALGAVASLYRATMVDAAFAIWTFWLVQSSHGLFPLPVQKTKRRGRSRDPFEQALARADEIMDAGGSDAPGRGK